MAVVDPNNDVTYFAYDNFGNRTVTWDPLLNATVDYFDGIGRRYASVSPKGVASGDYNAFATFFGYDNLSNLVYVVDPLDHVTFFGYDANRNPTTVTDANNRVTSTTCDLYDQPQTVTRPDGWSPGPATTAWATW